VTGTERRTTTPPAAGTAIDIVKLQPDGSEAIRYPGEVIPSPDGWIAALAPWGQRRMDLGYLIFEPTDIFLEFFSTVEPLNVFANFTADGTLKGWYCNVTRLSWMQGNAVYWHDLYIDVIAYPDRDDVLVLDEDELAASGVETSDPALYQLIMAGRARLLAMVAANAYPFIIRKLPE
jgi:hypothetical protein